MTFRDLADMVLDQCLETMGESAVYTPAIGGSPFPVTGIFDRSSLIADAGAGADVQTYAPTFRMKLSDLPSPPAEGDQVAVQGGTYGVVDRQDDGYGDLILILEKLT